MSYQVLARKWRPKNFEQVVGQEHVLKVLSHALDHDRIHHAFLFTGTRGVGKTTIARILAKALNCEKGVSATPCGECAHCRDIDAGRFFDLIEVDAASRTKVDDTRDMLENVQYMPAQGRYKIYLIDEVHMLSNHSFNALLKTLEEPPAHVKFLLATTDPQKLPVTILSRCLQFHLKALSIEQITQNLEKLLEKEKITYELEALKQIARSADGSIRDSLSLLDQAISMGNGNVKEADVHEMLGVIEQSYYYDILDHLATKNGNELLNVSANIAERSASYADVLVGLIDALYAVALTQTIPEASTDELGDLTRIRQLADQLSPGDVQLYYQIALNGRQDLSHSPHPRIGFEMVLLRMLAFTPVKAGPAQSFINNTAAKATGRPTPSPQAMPSAPATTPKSVSPAPSKSPDELLTQWDSIIPQLNLGQLLEQFLRHCCIDGVDNTTITLSVDDDIAHLRNSTTDTQLTSALQARYGKGITVKFIVKSNLADSPASQETARVNARVEQAQNDLLGDPVVRQLQERFDAQIVPGSIKPNTEDLK